MLAVWRRERDSNPRCLSTSPVFKTGSLNHSDISPSYSCLDIIAIRHRIVKAFRRKPGKRGDGKGHRPLSLSKNPRGLGGRNAVRKGRAASARGAFLALPCSLGFRLAPPATGGVRLCPPEAFIGFGGTR